jgi:hypothetical protein
MASDATTSEKQFHGEVADASKDPHQGGVKEKIKKFEQKEPEKRYSSGGVKDPTADQGGVKDRIKRYSSGGIKDPTADQGGVKDTAADQSGVTDTTADQGGVKDRIKRFESKEAEKTTDSNELATAFSRINGFRTVKLRAEAEAGKDSNDAPIQDKQIMQAAAQEGSLSRDPPITEHQSRMDKTLKQCFLQAISTRLLERDFPIDAMTLYEKHMRMCRPIDFNCTVQDSSFVSLKAFFQSLENAGLVELESSANEDTPKVIAVNRNHSSIQEWQPWPHKSTVACLKIRGKR